MEAAFIEAVNFRLYVCMCFGFFCADVFPGGLSGLFGKLRIYLLTGGK